VTAASSFISKRQAPRLGRQRSESRSIMPLPAELAANRADANRRKSAGVNLSKFHKKNPRREARRG